MGKNQLELSQEVRQSMLSSNQRRGRLVQHSPNFGTGFFFLPWPLRVACHIAHHIQSLLASPVQGPSLTPVNFTLQHYLHIELLIISPNTSQCSHFFLPFCLCFSLGLGCPPPPELQAKFYSVFKIQLRYHLQETLQGSLPPSLFIISASCTFFNCCAYNRVQCNLFVYMLVSSTGVNPLKTEISIIYSVCHVIATQHI